ncbi:MAG TPA: DUF1016 N-terminal domain-containing protein [Prosthecobacter sp.]|nr:DUF1016 N-terminal domain-containing protein [Prosthecobacter sp.]
MKKKSASPKSPPAISADAGGYVELLADIKKRIRAAQIRTVTVSNAGMLMLYWKIGSVLAERQKLEGWGAGVLPRLALDLKNGLPEEKGFSTRNLKLMTQFFREYPGLGSIGQRAVAQLGGGTIRPRVVAQLKNAAQDRETRTPAVAELAAEPWRDLLSITWAHNLILMQKVKDLPTRLWYARQALEQGWSRDVLSLQIQSGVHKRQGKAVTNFQATLPPPQSDLAAQLPQLSDEPNQALAA